MHLCGESASAMEEWTDTCDDLFDGLGGSPDQRALDPGPHRKLRRIVHDRHPVVLRAEPSPVNHTVDPFFSFESCMLNSTLFL